MNKVLIVDDKTENLYLLQSLLDSSGFKTISARNGAEALGLIKTDIPELIISDVLMPVMDGFTLCRECKKDEVLKEIPFFFYTATYTDHKDKEYALSLGADRFILKPQEPEDFLKIINDFLKDVKMKRIHPKKVIQQADNIILKEYNEVLIRKIEDKILQTEKAEKELRKYAEELEKEILERKKNEVSLQKSQLLFQTLANVSPVGIFRTDPDGSTTYVNPKWLELTGFKFEEAVGFGWLNAVHPDDREMLENRWKSDVKSQVPSIAEYRFKRPDGGIVWVMGDAAPELIGEKIIGYVGTITDITERKIAESELIIAKNKAEESDKLKTAFLHNISHEVRTPMNAIVGFSDLIVDPDLAPEIRNEFIQTIVQASNQLLSIITQIVSMATIESGLEKTYEKEFSLNSIIRLLYDQFSRDIACKKLQFNYNTALQDGNDIIRSDETKLIQIISNLLANSLKFTNEGSINFGYVIKGNFLEVYVKDTGIGVPMDMNEKVFERFRKVESSLAREYEGAGLGLSISKAYVELLGGQIWLKSNLGEGAEFFFTIPLNKADLSSDQDFNKSEGTKQMKKKPVTILVTEDTDNNYLLISQYLADAKINVLRANNGLEAVNICINNSDIDLVLMDLKMPVMDGFEATQKILEIRPDLPIIAQTAYVRDSDVSKALEVGCSDFICKPYKKDALLAVINNYIFTD